MLASFFLLIGITSCISVSNIKKWEESVFVRSENNPMIYPEMEGLEGRLGKNINGPSVIKVPNWIENPLGKYYMYFAHHHGKYIRLAYADSPTGPWKIYKKGVLHLKETAAVGHIASPDVIIDQESKTIKMYFHGPTPNKNGQKTFLSTSKNGLTFKAKNTVLGPSYFRVFEYKNHKYALVSGTFYKFLNDNETYKKGAVILPNVRHTAVTVIGDNLVVFYSQKGDAPERILKTVVNLDKDDWQNWKAEKTSEVLTPEMDYEGVALPIQKSVNGFSRERVHQLRDPAIFIDKKDVYLYYSIAGEAGIAVAKMKR